MSRSHHRLKRILPAPHSEVFLCVLSQFPVSPGARQGFTRNQRSPATRPGHRCRVADGRRATPSLRTTRSLIAYSCRRSKGLALKMLVPRHSLALNPQFPRGYFQMALGDTALPETGSASSDRGESRPDQLFGRDSGYDKQGGCKLLKTLVGPAGLEPATR
jgi:hypothetical protein